MRPPLELGTTFVLQVFLGLFTRHMLLMAILLLIALVLFADLGSSLGLPRLFWHPRIRTQLAAGAGVAALVMEVVLVGFLRDRDAIVRGHLAVTTTQYFEGCAALLSVAFVLAWALARLVRRRDSPAVEVAQRWPFILGACGAATTIVLAINALSRFEPTAELEAALGSIPGFGVLPPLDRHLHLAALVVFAVNLVVYLVAILDRGRRVTTAALALCALVGLVVLAHGFVAARLETAAAVVAVVIAMLIAGGMPPYKVRIRALREFYLPRNRFELPGRRPTLAPSLVPWANLGKRRPLVLVSASGPGSAAAVWVLSILSGLERRLPRFPYHCRIVTGSSGAALGGALYVGSLLPPSPRAPPGGWHHRLPERDLVSLLQTDGLSPIAHRVVTWDLPMALLPSATSSHRGATFESFWSKILGDLVPRRLGDSAAEERAGWRPSLLFEARLIEDGQPLLLTNLDIETESPDVASVQGHLGELPLPACIALVCGGDFVLPAQALPSRPRRRVRAARPTSGFLGPLLGWLDACVRSAEARAWLHREVSGILLLEIGTTVRHGATAPVLRGFEEVVGPFEVLPREGQTTEDIALRSLAANLNAQLGAGAFKHASFVLEVANSSWLLGNSELEHVREEAKSADSSLTMASILRWWQDHSSDQASYSAHE